MPSINILFFFARLSNNIKPFVWALNRPIVKRLPRGGRGYISNSCTAGPCDASAMVMFFFIVMKLGIVLFVLFLQGDPTRGSS